MRILYVAMKFDYGKPEQGYSFEHHNFHDSLLHMGHDILYFDFMTLLQKRGRDWMNRRLLEAATSERPDLMFTVLFTDELDRGVVREITDKAGIVTLNWFCDDHWRFEDYSRHWAGCFRWVVTTAASALPKYERAGLRNVIKSQWACNHFLYRRLDLASCHEVTFVGQPHGDRRAVVQALRDAGIAVGAWGTGWESGRLSQDEMIRLFNESRINLNLTNASVAADELPRGATAHRAGRWVRDRLARSLDPVPLGPQLKRMAMSLRPAVKRMAAPLERKAERIARGSAAVMAQPAPGCARTDQIKGRNFEIPGTGGFLLTGRAEELDRYYEIGREIVCFDDVDDLLDKARYYLAHEGERADIARAGYERTLREHTYVHRFREIFERCGLRQREARSIGLPAESEGWRVEQERVGSTEDVT